MCFFLHKKSLSRVIFHLFALIDDRFVGSLTPFRWLVISSILSFCLLDCKSSFIAKLPQCDPSFSSIACTCTAAKKNYLNHLIQLIIIMMMISNVLHCTTKHSGLSLCTFQWFLFWEEGRLPLINPIISFILTKLLFFIKMAIVIRDVY